MRRRRRAVMEEERQASSNSNRPGFITKAAVAYPPRAQPPARERSNVGGRPSPQRQPDAGARAGRTDNARRRGTMCLRAGSPAWAFKENVMRCRCAFRFEEAPSTAYSRLGEQSAELEDRLSASAVHHRWGSLRSSRAHIAGASWPVVARTMVWAPAGTRCTVAASPMTLLKAPPSVQVPEMVQQRSAMSGRLTIAWTSLVRGPDQEVPQWIYELFPPPSAGVVEHTPGRGGRQQLLRPARGSVRPTSRSRRTTPCCQSCETWSTRAAYLAPPDTIEDSMLELGGATPASE